MKSKTETKQKIKTKQKIEVITNEVNLSQKKSQISRKIKLKKMQ